MQSRSPIKSENQPGGLRDRLDRNKPVVLAVVAVMMATGLFLICRTLLFSAVPDVTVGMNFYSDDDGKTWFPASDDHIPPFDHNGKPAYEAEVYRTEDGRAFVAYMTSWQPEDKAAIEAAAPKDRRNVEASLATKQLAKKPGQQSWVSPQKTKEYQAIISPVGPDGPGKNVLYVSPPTP